VGDGIGGTYGAESFVCVCFHAEETRFHLVVAEQWWVELDAHDLRLAGRTLDLVFQIHPLTKVSVHVKKQKKPSLVPIRIHAHAHVLPSIHPSTSSLAPRHIAEKTARGWDGTDGRTDGRTGRKRNKRAAVGDGTTTTVVVEVVCARTLVSMESILADDTFPFTFPKCLA
jgi:hypothetical protein